MIEEIYQLNTNKTKEKMSQHDLKHITDKEEILVEGASQNT